jgi:protease PrsW
MWFWGALPLIISALLVNFILPANEFSVYEQAQNAQYAGNYAIAEKNFIKLLDEQPLDVLLHRERIQSHFNISKKIGKNTYRDDENVSDFYKKLSRADDVEKADIGHYGLGFIEIQNDNHQKALEQYLKVQNQHLPYLNNSIGYAYMAANEFEVAEHYFRQEIALSQNQSGAYSNLARLFAKTNDFKRLGDLLAQDSASEHVTSQIKREYYYKTKQYGQYFKQAFAWHNFGQSGFIGAVLILAVWLVFVIKIDVFEREKYSSIVLVFCLGCGFSMLTQPMYDFLKYSLNFRLEGEYFNDFFYCIFAIGLVEETVKIIPVLLIMQSKRIFNESTDFVIYASISALGFAFMENLLYFDDAGLDNIVSRSLSATVLHMSLTSFVAYGLFYAKYKAKANQLRYFLFSFASACLIHGFYDFWLMSDGWVGELRIFSVLILVYVIQRYAYAISNVLCHSEFNLGGTHLISSSRFLAFSLFAIASYQYLVLAYKYGTENANLNLVSLVLSSGFLVFFLVMQLGRIEVTQDAWISVLKGKK